MKGQGIAELRGRTVLVVEDEWILALNYRNLLSGAGCRVLGPVPNEEKALEILQDEEPDIALLDLNLNGSRPMRLAARLGERDIPFIIVTGYGRIRDREPAFSGAAILTKPVSETELLHSLARRIDPTRQPPHDPDPGAQTGPG